MSLHFQLQVNGLPIGTFYARRLNHVLEKGKPSRYEYDVKIDGSFIGPRDMVQGTVEHLYEDGVLSLIKAVIIDIESK